MNSIDPTGLWSLNPFEWTGDEWKTVAVVGAVVAGVAVAATGVGAVAELSVGAGLIAEGGVAATVGEGISDVGLVAGLTGTGIDGGTCLFHSSDSRACGVAALDVLSLGLGAGASRRLGSASQDLKGLGSGSDIASNIFGLAGFGIASLPAKPVTCGADGQPIKGE